MKISHHINIIITSSIIFLAGISSTDAQPSDSPNAIDYFRGFAARPSVIDVLFPEEEAQDFQTLPSVPDTFWDTIFPQLPLPSYFAEGQQDTGGLPFYGYPSAVKNFKSYDFTGDGHADIMYSGDYAYAEGTITLLWQHTGKNHYTRIDMSRPPFGVSGQVLKIVRVDRSKPISFLLATYACCAGYIDEFCWYHPQIHKEKLSYRVGKKIQLFWGTELPAEHVPGQAILANSDKTPLRASPAVFDAHDTLRSEIEARAVYGNILAEFVATSTGFALGRQTDNDGRLWYFVMMDAADYKIGYTRFYDVYYDRHIDAYTCGWMEANDLSFVK